MAKVVSSEWVLVIDDDPVAGRACARWIRETLALDVRGASSIGEAEDFCDHMPEPLAIVTDFELSQGTDGLQALQRIRARGWRAPAVLVTGSPEQAAAIALGQPDEAGEVLPIIGKSEPDGPQRLADWLRQVQLCCSGLTDCPSV